MKNYTLCPVKFSSFAFLPFFLLFFVCSLLPAQTIEKLREINVTENKLVIFVRPGFGSNIAIVSNDTLINRARSEIRNVELVERSGSESAEYSRNAIVENFALAIMGSDPVWLKKESMVSFSFPMNKKEVLLLERSYDSTATTNTTNTWVQIITLDPQKKEQYFNADTGEEIRLDAININNFNYVSARGINQIGFMDISKNHIITADDVEKYNNGRVVEFTGFFGIYLNGWHENTFSGGFPLQLGAEFNFLNMSLNLQGEAGVGIGLGPLLEWNFGGITEFYFIKRKFGIGFGYGFVDSTPIFSYEGDSFQTTYMRFALIYANDFKTTIYAHLYGDGKWGFGVQWGRGKKPGEKWKW